MTLLVTGEAPYTDYYVWADASGWDGDTPLPPNNWLSKVRTSAWEWSRERGQFYYHQYQAAQPDLNYRNRLEARSKEIRQTYQVSTFTFQFGY